MARQAGGKRRLHGVRVLGLLLVLGLGYLVSLAVRIELAGRRDERQPADVIVVLGTTQNNGKPSAVLQARLDYALDLYRDGYAPYLLFTGGKMPGDRYTEAEAGQLYVLARGVPADAILLEDEGRTTWQSLQRTDAIMRRQRLSKAILVSDPFHALRLRRMARDLGLHAVISPVKHSAIRSRHKKLQYILREVGTYTLYRLFGM